MYKIKIKELQIEILKSIWIGTKMLKLRIDNLILTKKAVKDNSESFLKGSIYIDYFNKRIMQYEPFLEPWVFIMRYYTKLEEY